MPDTAPLSRREPSILHAHFGMDAVDAAPLADALSLPMIVTLHGFDININREWWESGKGGISRRRYPLRLLELATRPDVYFIAVSDSIRRQAIAYGIPEAKIQVMYIGLDLSRFQPGPVPINDRGRRVLFVGRLVEKKGCEYLLRAMRVVNRAVGDTEVVIVGDGSQRGAMETLAEQLGINATFKGVLSSAHVTRELDAARVFCLPSITANNGDAEGLGIVLLEAQAKGVPVVTSARGGRSEGIIHGETGFAFPERSIDDLAEALVRLLSDDRLAKNMAAAGPAFIRKNFNIVDCTQKLESFYDMVIARRIEAKSPTT